MKEIKWNLLFLAILAAASIIGIGMFLGAQNIYGIIFSFIVLVATMAYGFKTKKKMRNEGKI